jgi:hypothetical protein
MNKHLHEILKQSHRCITSPSNEVRWQKIIAAQEIIGLQKEVLHLQRKSSERKLSDWEQERLEEVQLLLARSTNGDSLTQ